MGQIVGATLCTHIPRLLMPEKDREEYVKKVPTTFFDAFTNMRAEKIERLDFDTFVIISTHWLSPTHLIIDGRPRHSGLYTSDEVPQMISDYPFNYAGDEELAELVAQESKKEFRKELARVIVVKQKNFPHHYSTLVPMHFLNGAGKYRILPTCVLYNGSVQNELNFGSALRRAIEKSNKRVVIVASGGLSHKFVPFDEIPYKASLDLSNIPPGNRKVDEAIIDLFLCGRHRNVIGMMEEYRKLCSPEGRFGHYIRMLGALGGLDCKTPAILFGAYEAAIGTGQINMWFDVPQ